MNQNVKPGSLPRRLPAEAVNNPQAFVEDFFHEYDLDACRNRLNDLVKDIMSCEISEGWDTRQRSNFVLFIENLEALITANHLVHVNS